MLTGPCLWYKLQQLVVAVVKSSVPIAHPGTMAAKGGSPYRLDTLHLTPPLLAVALTLTAPPVLLEATYARVTLPAAAHTAIFAGPNTVTEGLGDTLTSVRLLLKLQVAVLLVAVTVTLNAPDAGQPESGLLHRTVAVPPATRKTQEGLVALHSHAKMGFTGWLQLLFVTPCVFQHMPVCCP